MHRQFAADPDVIASALDMHATGTADRGQYYSSGIYDMV